MNRRIHHDDCFTEMLANNFMSINILKLYPATNLYTACKLHVFNIEKPQPHMMVGVFHPSLSSQQRNCYDCIWFVHSSDIIIFSVVPTSIVIFFYFSNKVFTLWPITFFWLSCIVDENAIFFWNGMFWLQYLNGFIWLYLRVDWYRWIYVAPSKSIDSLNPKS